jgi:lipoyl(octanoyl) transferase
MSTPAEAVWLGRVPYEEGLALQERAVAERLAGDAPDRLYLLEHPHVYTLGRGADRSNVLVSEAELAASGAGLYHTGRGGDVTYHGPGQLVGYPVISLKPDRCDVHRYVRDLEEALLRAAAEFGIAGERVPGLTGVWVGGEKLAAIGVRIARWVTSHGFALNVTTDLARFGAIVPCGISDRGVTSIARLTGRDVDVERVAEVVAHNFGEVFERNVTYRSAARLDQPARA